MVLLDLDDPATRQLGATSESGSFAPVAIAAPRTAQLTQLEVEEHKGFNHVFFQLAKWDSTVLWGSEEAMSGQKLLRKAQLDV